MTWIDRNPPPCRGCQQDRGSCPSGYWRACPAYQRWLHAVWPITTGLFAAGKEDVHGNRS